jgi:hypothetical protein
LFRFASKPAPNAAKCIPRSAFHTRFRIGCWACFVEKMAIRVAGGRSCAATPSARAAGTEARGQVLRARELPPTNPTDDFYKACWTLNVFARPRFAVGCFPIFVICHSSHIMPHLSPAANCPGNIILELGACNLELLEGCLAHKILIC